MGTDNSYHIWLWRKLGERCVKALKSHGFDARFVSSEEDAKKMIMEMISGYETFGFGGSNTTRALGILEELKAMGKTVFDHMEGGFSFEESRDTRVEQGRSDCFLSSANAISATGEIVNVDGVGNRTNALTFGPRKVILVAGMNKVTQDLDSAIRRVMEISAPMRAKSLNMNTPCAETGVCSDCNAPQRICRVTSILHRKPIMTDITVILVNQSLGF